jgi:hypothetical protein
MFQSAYRCSKHWQWTNACSHTIMPQNIVQQMQWLTLHLSPFWTVARWERSEVLTAVNFKITIFWDVMCCSLIDGYCFRGTCCFHHQGLKTEIVCSTKTLVTTYQTAWHHTTQDYNLNTGKMQSTQEYAAFSLACQVLLAVPDRFHEDI